MTEKDQTDFFSMAFHLYYNLPNELPNKLPQEMDFLIEQKWSTVGSFFTTLIDMWSRDYIVRCQNCILSGVLGVFIFGSDLCETARDGGHV